MKAISQFLFVLLLAAGVFNASAQNKKAKTLPAKPNIIYILADDLGTGDVSCYGSDSNRTPIVDQLARTGMRFTHAYTAPLCGPSRAMILTGRYAFRTGGVNQDRVGLIQPTDEVLMPTVLKAAGYTTTMIGKWSQFSLTPFDFGFDDYIKFKGSGVYWSNDKKKAETYTINGVDKDLEGYMPDLMHEHLEAFLSKNQKKPFFVYYAMSHVHALIQPTPDSKPDSKDWYGDNIAYMDKLVGKLLTTLDSLNLRKNTLIVFMGDNGTANAYAQRGTINGKKLSGKKGTMLECGSLVPTIANWPGVIAPGKVSNQLIDATDLIPTFAELVKAPLPTKKPLDGRSFLPTLLGKPVNPRDWIFIELGNKWYAREENWKLNRAGELFDMRNAPFTEPLVAADNQDEAALAAKKRLQAVLDNLNPAAGFVDDGNGNGRHANKSKKKKEAAAE